MDWFLYDNGLRHERVNCYYLTHAVPVKPKELNLLQTKILCFTGENTHENEILPDQCIPVSQPTLTCSKSRLESPEQRVKSVQS